MQEDEIVLLMKAETTYLPDDGFSDRVVEALPVRRKFRMQVIALSWIVACIAGVSMWVLSQQTFSMFGLEPAMFWSVATLGFWSIVVLFVFITVNEGIFEF